jgi:hypothetical protein
MILQVDLSNHTFIALRWIEVNPTDPFPLDHCFGSARLRTPRWGQSSRCQAWGALVGSSMRGSTPDRSHARIGEAPACFRLALIEYWMQVPLRAKIECGGGVHASATSKRSVPAFFPYLCRSHGQSVRGKQTGKFDASCRSTFLVVPVTLLSEFRSN